MNDELENVFPVEEEVVDVPVPAPVVEPEPEPTPEPTVEPVVEPEPTPEPQPTPPQNSEIKVSVGSDGASRVSYPSNNNGCEPLNSFQSIVASVYRDGKLVTKHTSYKQGNAIFATPSPGEYTLKLSEGWTDFTTTRFKQYPETSFRV